MKKILTGILAAGLLLGSVVPAMAQESTQAKTVAPTRVWKYARAFPGHPVTLEGQGVALAQGRGRVRYQIIDGKVRVTGRGVVAVKGTTNVEVHGFGGKKEKGEWTYYFGKGTLLAKGANYELIAWGRFATRGEGSGKVTYRGFWNIKYHGMNVAGLHLESVSPPNDLKVEAGEEANLE